MSGEDAQKTDARATSKPQMGFENDILYDGYVYFVDEQGHRSWFAPW